MEAEDTAVDVLPIPDRPAEVDAVGRLKLLAAAGVAEAVLLRTFEELIGREVDGLGIVAVLMRLGLELEKVGFLNGVGITMAVLRSTVAHWLAHWPVTLQIPVQLKSEANSFCIFFSYIIAVCYCKLNNAPVCDEHLFGQVSTRTSCLTADIPLNKCAPANDFTSHNGLTTIHTIPCR